MIYGKVYGISHRAVVKRSVVIVASSRQVCIYWIVEALPVIYLFYLDSELILIDIRKPFRSSTCLLRLSWSLSS